MVGLAQCRITPLRGSAGAGAGAGPQQMPSALDYEEALALLRAALALPAGANDRTATRVLAAVLTMTQRGEEALPLARRAAELAPGDAGAASLHAHLLLRGVSQEAGGREGVTRALKACEAAVASLSARGCATPAALLNNVGVLRCRLAAFAVSAAERANELALSGAAFEKALTQVRVGLVAETPGARAADADTDSEGFAGAGTARFTRDFPSALSPHFSRLPLRPFLPAQQMAAEAFPGADDAVLADPATRERALLGSTAKGAGAGAGGAPAPGAAASASAAGVSGATLAFNLARLLEFQGRTEEAEVALTALARAHPGYGDA